MKRDRLAITVERKGISSRIALRHLSHPRLHIQSARDHTGEETAPRGIGLRVLILKTISEGRASFGPREENSRLKGPLLNALTLERTKHNFSYNLMLQARCVYIGLSSPVRKPTTPTHPEGLVAPCPAASVISTEEYSNPSLLMFPLLVPQTSL